MVRTNVARLVLARGTPMAPYGRAAIVNGRPGAVVVLGERVAALVAFGIEGGRVIEMELLVDPARLATLRVWLDAATWPRTREVAGSAPNSL